MGFATRHEGVRPFGDINTTPLIDVMLVLLVMLIFTIPPATQSVDIDLPQQGDPLPFPVPDPVRNKIVLTTDGRILWNGDTINQSQLQASLVATTRLRPEPELQFEPEPQASYDLSAKVLRSIKASGATKFGFVGNERYRAFTGGPEAPH